MVVLIVLGIISTLFCLLFIEDVEYVNRAARQPSILEDILHNIRYYKTMKGIVIILVLDGFILGFISSSVSKILPIPRRGQSPSGSS